MKPLNEMTAEELIAQFDSINLITNLKSTYELALALRNKLKEAITPNPDEIHIVWSVEDVYEIAEMKRIKIPTVEQAREALRRCKKHHDACFDVSWETIDDHLTDVLKGR